MPVASCRTPMSETYDIVKWRWSEWVVVLDVVASSLLMGDPKESVVVAFRGSPKLLEKPMGSIMACDPVATADIAKIKLTDLKMGRR